MITVTIRAVLDRIPCPVLASDSEQVVVALRGIASAIGVGVCQQQAIAVDGDGNAS